MPDHQRIAVFGGVYNNYLALAAAIHDAKERDIDACYCLGDLGAFLKRSGNMAFIVIIVLINMPGSPFRTVVGGLLKWLLRLFGVSGAEAW